MKNSKLLFITLTGICVLAVILMTQLWVQSNKYKTENLTPFHPDSMLVTTEYGPELIQIKTLSATNTQTAFDALTQLELTKKTAFTPIENAYRLLVLLAFEKNKNNYEQAQQYSEDLHRIADQEQYAWLKAATYLEQAHIYALQDQKEQGKDSITKAIDLAKKEQALYLLPAAYRIAGFLSNTSNKLILAQDYFIQGIDVAEKLAMHDDNAKLHNNLAVLYMLIQDWDKALEVLQIANALYSKNPNVNAQMMHVLYSNESKIQHELNNKEASKRALFQADLYYDEDNALPRSKILHWKSHSQLMLLEGNYDKALTMIEQCLSYPFIHEYPSEVGKCHLIRSNILVKQHHYEEALRDINKSIDAFIATKYDRALTHAYSHKAIILTSLKRESDALAIYKIYFEREREQILSQMYELVRSVETKKIAQERDLLNVEKRLAETQLEKQRLLLHIMSFGSALIVVVLFFAVRQVIRVKHTNKKLEVLSHVDTLTGLYNRRYYYQQLIECCTIDAEDSYRIVLFDIDDFKWINDEHGHDVGDEVLMEISRRINALLRPQELLTRWGGEEFLALIKDDHDIMTRVEQLRLTIYQTPFMTNAGELCVSCSIGVSTAALPCDIDGNDDYFRKADKNLYEAKRSGKNQVIFPSI